MTKREKVRADHTAVTGHEFKPLPNGQTTPEPKSVFRETVYGVICDTCRKYLMFDHTNCPDTCREHEACREAYS